MRLPTFSIVICNYNYGRFVGEAIESCLAQDYLAELFETIVVDDGSTDDSREVIARYASRPRVTVVEQANQGQAAAFAAGVAQARNDFVCFLDSDDIFLPGKLARVAARIASLGPVQEQFFLCHDLEIFDQRQAAAIEATWFQTMRIDGLRGEARLDEVNQQFAFSVPCGQVLDRTLAQTICEGLPTADWRQGADGAIAHAAFLAAGRVYYEQAALARYRVHGSNSVARIRDGRYDPHPKWRARWPKQLSLLESVVDTLELHQEQRAQRLAYLKRLERLLRDTPRSLRLAAPVATFIVLDDGIEPHLRATIAAAAASTYARVEVIVVTEDPGRAGTLRVPPGANVSCAGIVAPDALPLARLREGLAQANGDFIAVLRAGDLPDPVFMERHVHAHGASRLSAVTSSDIRVINDAGVLLHAGVFNASGLWRRGEEYLPPFSVPLGAWAFAPLSANVVRRTRLLDGLIADQVATQEVSARFHGWLLLNFASMLGGVTRINECLLSHRVADNAQANYATLMVYTDAEGKPDVPYLEDAALALFEAYCRCLPAFEHALPPVWHERCIAWLRHGCDEETLDRMRCVAKESGATRVLAWLEE